MTLYNRSIQVFGNEMFKVKKHFYNYNIYIFSDLVNVATNSEIPVNPSDAVIFS